MAYGFWTRDGAQESHVTDEDRLQAWFEFLGDTYTPESFDDAMAKFDAGEEPPAKRPTQVRTGATSDDSNTGK